MDYYDQCLALNHLRNVRRRYLARTTRNVCKSWMHAARSNRGKAGLVPVIGVAVISAVLWMMPHVR
jgi:hypothetical protein